MPVVPVGSEGLNTPEMHLLKLRGKGLGVTCAAVGIRVYGILRQDGATLPTWTLLKGLSVTGRGQGEVRLRGVTGTPANADEYQMDAVMLHLAHLRRVFSEDIGEATEGQARNHARRALQSAADHAYTRDFLLISGLPDVLPERGDTVQVGSWTGVVREWTEIHAAGFETLQLSLTDYNAGVFNA